MLKLEYVSINEIKAYERNPRKNSKSIEAVAASIKEFGVIVPIVLDDTNTIVAGHTRVIAARKLGIRELPCTRATGLTEAQINAYRLADNKTGEAADWDLPALEIELSELSEEGMEKIDNMGFGLAFEEALVMRDTTTELDIADYGDEAFEYTCPECGFKFNEK